MKNIKMEKFKFPNKSYIFPDAKDNNCSICQKDISEGQVILMLDGGVSVNAHFHKEHIFDGVAITEGACDLNFCSSTCLKR